MRKIQHKIWLWAGGVLTTTLILAAATVLVVQKRLFYQELEHTGNALASTAAAFCVELLLQGDYPYLQTYVAKSARENGNVVFVKVWERESEDGTLKLVARYPDDDQAGEDPNGFQVFTSAVTVKVSGLSTEHLGQVDLGLSTQRIRTLLAFNAWQLGLGTLAVLGVLSVVLAVVLRRHVLAPIEALDDHARRIAAGSLEAPIVLPGGDELGRLASTMDMMRTSVRESHAQILEQVEELKALDVMKDEFLAATSHELRTPLNGILGFTQSLLQGVYGELPGDLIDPLRRIDTCGRRLLDMTESILRFSALQAGRKAETPRLRHDLGAHLEDALVDLTAIAGERGIELRVKVPGGFEVSYRREELEQLVRILVDNAIKYTHHGFVEVMVSRWQGKVDGFQLGVRDTGIGIKAENQARVFDAFYQGESRVARAHGGVGLGLAIARKLEGLLGTKLVLESEVGTGTTVTILVPSADGEQDIAALLVPWPERQSATTHSLLAPETLAAVASSA